MSAIRFQCARKKRVLWARLISGFQFQAIRWRLGQSLTCSVWLEVGDWVKADNVVSKLALTISRMALVAWVGAATLFVTTGIAEVRDPRLDAITKNILVTLRFPAYYAFGFILVGIAMICCGPGLRNRGFSAIRRACWAMIVFAFCLMIIDYVFVFRPLFAMISPPESPLTARFETLHTISKWINAAGIALCLLASLLLCWPMKNVAAAGNTE